MLCSAEENFNQLTLLFKSSVYDLVASDGGVKSIPRLTPCLKHVTLKALSRTSFRFCPCLKCCVGSRETAKFIHNSMNDSFHIDI